MHASYLSFSFFFLPYPLLLACLRNPKATILGLTTYRYMACHATTTHPIGVSAT